MLDIHRYEEEPEDTALRHPRHVIKKVRECHTILSKLLKEKNIEVKPIPDLFSIREVRSSDVQNGVHHLLQDALQVKEVTLPDVAFEAGKVPSDVYNNLKRICASIKAEIVPSDVYQVAAGINKNLNKIVQVRGYEFTSAYEDFEGKTPADVYKETWAFLEDLRTLALNPDFSIPGGVIVPSQVPEGKIIPQDVIALMHDALAETIAMKYTLGIREKTSLPQYQDGKTSSDVFSQIRRAHAVVKTLLAKERAE
ncbi:MAG: hypothetical protein KTR28_08180 [Micavibrio sp.]|nr:hypothetical protein [Micavibrio sp.]